MAETLADNVRMPAWPKPAAPGVAWRGRAREVFIPNRRGLRNSQKPWCHNCTAYAREQLQVMKAEAEEKQQELEQRILEDECAKEEADIRKAIDDLSTQLTFVLIQDHMDESLVMLRRLFCWDLDDIIYAALKVSGGSRSEKTSKPAIPQEVRDAIDKHICADK